MFKKLVVGLLLATGISSATHALTIEDFKQLSEGDFRKSTIMYLGGVNWAFEYSLTNGGCGDE